MPNIYDLRTNEIRGGDGYFNVTPSGTVNNALTDALDSSYVRKISNTLGFGLTMRVKDPATVTGGTAIPIAGHYITSIQTLSRQSQGATGNTTISTGVETGGVGGTLEVLGGQSVSVISGTLTGPPATLTTVTSASRAATGIITVTTAAAHFLSVGTLIMIQGSSTGTPTGFVNGSYRVLTVGSSTTFTAQDVSAYSGFTASTVNATNGNLSLGQNASAPAVAPSSLSATTGTAAQDIVNNLIWWVSDSTSTTLADRAYYYEAWMRVVTAALPTVTVNGIDGDTSAPYSVTTTSRPTVTWTHAQADGYTQGSYRVKVFTSAKANPDTATDAVWDSGTVNSATGSAQITTDLVNGSTYFVYVKTRTYTSTTNDDGWSLWGSGTAASGISFTVALPAPTAPIISLTWGATQQRVRAVLTGKAVTAPMTAQTFDLQRSDDGGVTWYFVRGGMSQTPDGSFQVTDDDFEMKRGTTVRYRARSVATGAGNTIASAWNGYNLWDFEANTTGWTAGTNTTVSQSATQAYAGGFSMRLAPTAAGTVSATAGSLTATPVVVGGSYTASAWLRSTSASRTATLSLVWYTAANALISTSAGTGTTITTSGFTQVSVVATAPATAAYAVVSVSIAATGSAADFQYVDNVEFAATTATVVVPALTNWVFRSLGTSGELNIVKDVKVLADLDLEQTEDVGVFSPLGRSAKVVVHGTIRGDDGTYNILCPDQATFDSLLAVVNGRALVLVADPFGEQKYVQVISRNYRKTGAAASPRYYVTLGYVEAESGLTAG
jgi:hypothetical protein